MNILSIIILVIFSIPGLFGLYFGLKNELVKELFFSIKKMTNEIIDIHKQEIKRHFNWQIYRIITFLITISVSLYFSYLYIPGNIPNPFLDENSPLNLPIIKQIDSLNNLDFTKLPKIFFGLIGFSFGLWLCSISFLLLLQALLHTYIYMDKNSIINNLFRNTADVASAIFKIIFLFIPLLLLLFFLQHR